LHEIVTTLVVALVISSAASTAVEPLCRKRITYLRPHTQRVFATVLVYALMILAVYLSVRALFTPFQHEIKRLIENLPAYKAQGENLLSTARTWYENLPPAVRDFVEQQRANAGDGSSFLPTAWLAGAAKGTVKSAGHIVELVLIPVLAFYFTLDGRKLRNQFLFLVPRNRMRQALAISSESGAIMRAYIASQFWLAVLAGVLVGVFLKILGMEYFVVLGLFAGITRAIPVVGPLLGGIPIVALAFAHGAQNDNPLLWVWVLVFFTGMHFAESKFIMPKFLGHALELHAVVIIVALLIGGKLFGPLGMFLAAPIAALARVLLMHYVIAPRRRFRPKKIKRQGKSRVLTLERAVRHSTLAASRVTAATKASTRTAKPGTGTSL
jgi:predicted PurR-regulated permease PerM